MNQIKLPSAGCLVAWTFGETPHEPCEEVFNNAGYGNLMPKRRNRSDCLASALSVMYPSKNHIVRSHKEKTVNGYEVIMVYPGALENDYANKCSVKPHIENAEHLEFWNVNTDSGICSYRERVELENEYRRQLMVFTGQQIGAALINVVTGPLSGVRMRDKGGLYWIPPQSRDVFTAFADSIARIGNDDKGRVDIMSMQTDERTMQAVRDHITGWVVEQVNAINEDILGDSDRSTEARLRRVAAIQSRIETYTPFIEDIKENLERLANEALFANTQIAANDFGCALAGVADM